MESYKLCSYTSSMYLRITQLEGLLVSDDGVNNEQHLMHDSDQGDHFGFALTLLLVKNLHKWVIGMVVFIRSNVGGSDMEKSTPN